MAGKASRSENPLVLAARILLFTISIFAAILVVDVVLLLLLSLDTGTWLTLLWCEGVIMAFFGGAGWWWGESPEPVFTPTGKLLTKVKLRYRYPWFWVSLGMAGLMLIILAGYLGLQYY